MPPEADRRPTSLDCCSSLSQQPPASKKQKIENNNNRSSSNNNSTTKNQNKRQTTTTSSSPSPSKTNSNKTKPRSSLSSKTLTTKTTTATTKSTIKSSPLKKTNSKASKMSPQEPTQQQQTTQKSKTNEDALMTTKTTTAPTLIATSDMCCFCFDTLIDALRHNRPSQTYVPPSPLSSSHDNDENNATMASTFDVSVQCPLFVTWETSSRQNNHSNNNNSSPRQWQLRGCIGTLSPKLLVTGIGEYAILAALRDRRFRPITLQEIPNLRVAVSLLVNYQECKNVYDWTIGIHGILIKFYIPQSNKHYNATYLPEVAKEQHWNHQQTIESLIQKAGYHGKITKELLQSIHCTRYESSKCRVTFQEYKMYKLEERNGKEEEEEQQNDDDFLADLGQQPASPSTCTNM